MSNSENKNRIKKISKNIQNPKKDRQILVDWSVRSSTDSREPEPGEILIIWGKDDTITVRKRHADGSISKEIGGVNGPDKN